MSSQVFYGENDLAALFGGLSLSLALVFFAMIRWGRKTESLPTSLGAGLALAIYGLLSVAAVVWSRIDLLLTSPIESRYQSFGLWWIIGLLLTGAALIPVLHNKFRTICITATCVVAASLCAGTLHAMPFFQTHGRNMQAATSRLQDVLRNVEDPSRKPELDILSRHYRAERIKHNLRRMRALGLLHGDLCPSGPP